MSILANIPPEKTIYVLAGHGNNGGDALVVSRILSSYNRKLIVFATESSEYFPSELRNTALQNYSNRCLPLSRFSSYPLESSPVIVDGLLGTGVSRTLSGTMLDATDHLHSLDNPIIIALDIISGVSADTGISLLKNTKAAFLTITFHRPKLGHFILPSKMLASKITVVDIGLPNFNTKITPLKSDKILVNNPSLWESSIRKESLSDHKYTRGVVAIKSSSDMIGASILASQAARILGCGMVVLLCSKESKPVLQSIAPPGIVIKEYNNNDHLISLLNDKKISSILIGPGDTDKTQLKRIIPSIINNINKPLTLDAGALTSFEDDPNQLISPLANSNHKVVITPHIGEYYRLFCPLPNAITTPQMSAYGSELTRQTVLLKGNDTCISSPDFPTILETNATPTLATAGSGDILSGLIASIMAQSLPPHLAAARASYIHSNTTKRLKTTSSAEDILKQIKV